MSGDSRPLIGLTTYVARARLGSSDEVSALLPMSYVSAVVRAGGAPVLLPPSPADPLAVLGALGGLVIPGGPDIDPARYGAAPHEQTGRSRPERDAWETALVLAALEIDLPLLAICRGVQVLNVALGGTLHQHLPEVIGSDVHRVGPGEFTANIFTVQAGTIVAGILGTAPAGVCRHHQAVDRLGRRLSAVGFSAEGVIEAVEIEGQRFGLGVQWHPEDDPSDDRLFEALVEAATTSGSTVAPRAEPEEQEGGLSL